MKYPSILIALSTLTNQSLNPVIGLKKVGIIVFLASSCLHLNAQGNLISTLHQVSEPRERFDSISAMTQYNFLAISTSSENEADTLIVLDKDTVRLYFYQEQKEIYPTDRKTLRTFYNKEGLKTVFFDITYNPAHQVTSEKITMYRTDDGSKLSSSIKTFSYDSLGRCRQARENDELLFDIYYRDTLVFDSVYFYAGIAGGYIAAKPLGKDTLVYRIQASFDPEFAAMMGGEKPPMPEEKIIMVKEEDHYVYYYYKADRPEADAKLKTTLRYDTHLKLIEEKEDYDLDGEVDTHIEFTYFDDGRIKERYNLLTEKRYPYEYDEQNRLLTEYSSYTKTTYTYDHGHPFWTTQTIRDLYSGEVQNWRVRTFVK
jgi:hypothetical protein